MLFIQYLLSTGSVLGSVLGAGNTTDLIATLTELIFQRRRHSESKQVTKLIIDWEKSGPCRGKE